MSEQKITGAEIMALAAPTFVFAGFEFANKILLPPFLSQHVGLNMGLVGALLVGLRLFDIATDGVVGAACDGMGARWGRRRAWMAAGTPIALFSMWFAFTAPPGAGAPGLALALATMTVGWTMINGAHGAWALEAASGIEARARVFAARTAAGIAGTMSFSGVAAYEAAHGGEPLRAMAMILILGVPATNAWLFLRVPDHARRNLRITLRALLEPFVLGLASVRNLTLAGLFALVGANAACAAGSFVFLVKFGLGVSDATTALFVQAGASGIGLILGLALNRRLGAEALLALTFSARLLIFGALPLVDGAAQVLVWSMLLGVFSAPDFVLLRALAGEELDADTGQTGISRAGTYYAGFHFPYNLAGAIATGALFGAYAFVGFDPNQGVDERIARAVVWIPACGGVMLAALSLWVLGVRRAGSSVTN